MQVESYLIKKGFQFKRRGENAIFNCPFCGDKEKKFAISLTTGAYNCLHLNNCGVKGSFWDFQTKLGDKPEREKKDFAINMKPKTYVKPTTKIIDPVITVKEYLKKRGFSEKTIKDMGFGGADADTIQIPYYKNGILVNIKYRSISDKKKMRTEKDAEPCLFNRDNVTDNQLIICEGEYDCAALYQYGITAVSIPNGASGQAWVEHEWDFLESFSEIVICFDMDSAGQEGAKNLAIRLGEWRCKNALLPYKDANECLLQKVALSEMQDCFLTAEDFSPETLVTPMYFHDKVQNLFRQGRALFGTQTPWDGLNEILKGWRGGEVTIWSGRNGSGKSTALNQVFIDLGTKDVKSCIYSGEMPPERYLRWAVIQHQKNDSPHPEIISKSISWMSNRVYILNITAIIDPDKLLGDFEYAARRYGVKHFIIDSLMKIKFNLSDEYRQQTDFVSRLCNFAQKFDCHVHLVAHPRKTESDDDETGKVDIKGSGHITDLCHNVIVMLRVTEKKKEMLRKKGIVPPDMKLFVKKNREFGIEGCVNMAFSEITKSFSD